MSPFNLGFRLLVVTTVAGLALGCVQHITKEPIAHELERQRQVALRQTLPQADNFKPYQLSSEDPYIKDVAIGYSNDQPVGANITVASNGYGGPVNFIVGIDAKGVIQGLKVTSHTETPGLGANAAKDWFQDRFKGLSGVIEVVKGEVSKNSKVDSTSTASESDESSDMASAQVQAITGATITSKAVTKGVNKALAFFKENLQKEMKP